MHIRIVIERMPLGVAFTRIVFVDLFFFSSSSLQWLEMTQQENEGITIILYTLIILLYWNESKSTRWNEFFFKKKNIQTRTNVVNVHCMRMKWVLMR